MKYIAFDLRRELRAKSTELGRDLICRLQDSPNLQQFASDLAKLFEWQKYELMATEQANGQVTGAAAGIEAAKTATEQLLTRALAQKETKEKE